MIYTRRFYWSVRIIIIIQVKHYKKLAQYLTHKATIIITGDIIIINIRCIKISSKILVRDTEAIFVSIRAQYVTSTKPPYDKPSSIASTTIQKPPCKNFRKGTGEGVGIGLKNSYKNSKSPSYESIFNHVGRSRVDTTAGYLFIWAERVNVELVEPRHTSAVPDYFFLFSASQC